MLETILPLAVLALAALAFGTLGYSGARYVKPETKWPLRIAVALATCVAVVDIISGFKLGMFAVIGPWLFGVGLGTLLRKQAEKTGSDSNGSNKQ
jgi:hypothetical protein